MQFQTRAVKSTRSVANNKKIKYSQRRSNIKLKRLKFGRYCRQIPKNVKLIR